MLLHDPKGNSAIVVVMSPLIRTKTFATHTDSLTNTSAFAVLVNYTVMKHASNYDRIDLVFDWYSEKSLKKTQDQVEEKVYSTYLKEILLKSLRKWLRVSSQTTKTRMSWRNICLWNFLNFIEMTQKFMHTS